MIPVRGDHRGLDACAVGFDLLQPLRPDNLQPLYSVGLAPLVQCLQPLQLINGGGHYYLAALPVLDFVFFAEAQ